jgi:hypothetical protein
MWLGSGRWECLLRHDTSSRAQATKSTTKYGKGTVSTNVADYKDKDLYGVEVTESSTNKQHHISQEAFTGVRTT